MPKQLVSQMTWGLPSIVALLNKLNSFLKAYIFFHDPLEEAIVAILNLTHGGDKRVSF